MTTPNDKPSTTPQVGRTNGSLAEMTEHYNQIEDEQAARQTWVPRLVSAAMLMDDGLIVPGVRHFSPDMRAVLDRIYGGAYKHRVKEQGFIDARGAFLDREQAWERAEATGQIREQVSTPGTLYSENLY